MHRRFLQVCVNLWSSFYVRSRVCIEISIYISPTSKSHLVPVTKEGRHVLQRPSSTKPYQTIRFNPSSKHTMGWLSSGSPSPSASPSPSGKGIAPNRSQRARCWEARDGFFQCLDRNNILDPIKEAPAAHASCGAQDVAFEKECVGSWVRSASVVCLPECPLIRLPQVEYFKKRRVMERNRETMLKKLEAEGAMPVAIPNPVEQAQKKP